MTNEFLLKKIYIFLDIEKYKNCFTKFTVFSRKCGSTFLNTAMPSVGKKKNIFAIFLRKTYHSEKPHIFHQFVNMVIVGVER